MRFDLSALKQRSDRLVWDDLDIAGSFAAQRLEEPALRCIRYMHDVEYHTACYLRDLLLGPAHADPEITGFLGIWAYQEFWHGEALSEVLAAHGEANGDQRVRLMRDHLGLRDRVRPLLMSLGGWVSGQDLTALQMTWGAINEWTTQAGYARLGRLAAHPVLSELLGRIMRQEGRHIDFYASQASARLAASQRAQRLTRFALRHLWQPVGSGVMPKEEVQHLATYLLGAEDGLSTARRIDRRIDRLPGLAGLGLVERSTMPLAA